jgi:excisionase family DNA binding protein
MSDILTIDEVATILSLHPETLRRKARFNEIPGFFKVSGKDWRIKKEDLDLWINHQKSEQVNKDK